jgi:hypothetical protein
MANTRAAHGLLARCALKNAVTAINAAPRAGVAPGDGAQSGETAARGRFLHLRMCLSGTEHRDPPLGWVLSEAARAKIAGYLHDAACNGETLARFLASRAQGAKAAAAPPPG